MKKLSRGISRATDNLNLVSQARSECAVYFSAAAQNLASNNAGYSFTLPDLSIYNKEFRWFLEKDLIEMATQTTLEGTVRLNWWLENGGKGLCQKLWTLNTTGDGNCLLHAASLAIWGFHDRLLTLRTALHAFFANNLHSESLYRRWRWQQMIFNEQIGLHFDELQWAKEWQTVVDMSSTEPRNSGNHLRETERPRRPTANRLYESLEEIHVLALAYVLKRPIIIIADTVLRNIHNEPLAPILFGGIYLPFEFPPSECHRSPLLLTFDTSHFCALVTMETSDKETQKPSLVPIMDSAGILLPVHFSSDPGVNHNWSTPFDQKHVNNLILNEKDLISLLKKYMDVVDPTELDQAVSPDPDSEDEIDKRFVECNDATENDNDNAIFAHKNKATKQLQSVAKQFGSIGKSMSKKIKKNFGSIAKPSKSKKADSSKKILLVELHITNTHYRESMVRNYMEFMMKKFNEEGNRVTSPSVDIMEELKLQEQSSHDETSFKCINTNCEFFGTAMTSYMCHKCYEKQKNQELTIKTDPRFGAGRSQFYRNSDHSSYDALRNIPVAKPNTNHNRTLYLSHSTFYCDTDSPLNLEKTEQQPEVKRVVAPTCTITSAENNNNQNNNNSALEIPPFAMEDYYDGLDYRNRDRPSNLSRSALDILNSSYTPTASLAPRHISEVNLNILKPHMNSTYIKFGPAMGHEVGKENIPGPAIENAHQYNFPVAATGLQCLQSRREEVPESGLTHRCKTVRCPNLSTSADTYCTECFKNKLKRILPS